MSVSERIEFLHKNLGLSITDFCVETGLNRAAVAKMIRLDTKPSFDAIHSILDRYKKLNPSWLLLGTGEMWFLSEAAATPLNAAVLLETIKSNNITIQYLHQRIKELEGTDEAVVVATEVPPE